MLKNVVAVALLIPTAWLLGETLLLARPPREYLLMMAGGILGIAASDTMFFKSLNLLGAGLTAIVACLYSPFIIILSLFFLNERLGLVQVLGVLLIVGAVLTPAFEKDRGSVSRRNAIAGTLWGAGGLLVVAVSIVMVKPLLDQSPLVWSSFLRMGGGVVGLTVFLAVHPGRMKILSTLTGPGLKYSLAGSVVGGYLSMLLWLAGMKHTRASVAAALNQTTNIFLFILAAVVLKEAVTAQRTVGIVLGVVGAALVTFG